MKQTPSAEHPTSNIECRASKWDETTLVPPLENALPDMMDLTILTNPINQNLIKIAVLCLGCVTVALGQHNQDELKQRILQQAQAVSADDYAFTRTIRTESTSNGKTDQHVNVEKFDPTKRVEARWTLVSVDGTAPSADALKTFQTDSGKRRIPGYHRLTSYFGTTATTSTDPHGRTVFHFAALPKDVVKVMDTDVSQNTSADASVSEANGAPFVEQVHFTVRPMRLKLVMKLDGYASTARYRIGPEGKPLLMEQTSDMSGSGLGKEGKIHTAVTYSDYRAVNKKS
ncbi:MAG: hypothetical protein QOI34_470 [Verrucomicrobiota bacterium]